MNIRVHLSFQICVFILFNCIPRNGIVGSYGNSIFSFWRSCILFSIVSQSVQSLSRIRLLVTPWTAACQASLSITKSQSLLKLTSIESVMPSNQLILCCPLRLLSSIFPNISDSVLCIRWPKYWSFSFSISPSNEYSGLISFRIDWSPCSPRDSQESSPTPQFKSINSALSFLYTPNSHFHTWLLKKTIALTRWTFVGKVMSLLFNMLSRFAIAFLLRNKRL